MLLNTFEWPNLIKCLIAYIYFEGMFDWRELDSRMKMRMNEFHSSYLVGESFIPILIQGGNRNAPIL